jgi:hypothetical protein
VRRSPGFSIGTVPRGRAPAGLGQRMPRPFRPITGCPSRLNLPEGPSSSVAPASSPASEPCRSAVERLTPGAGAPSSPVCRVRRR